MVKKIFLLSFVLICCVITTSCKKEVTTDISSTATVIPTQILPSPDISSSTLSDNQDPKNPLSAYKDVLQNKTEFITTLYEENGTKTIYLDQLLDDGLNNYKFLNFAVLDMDGDELPEVVIQYCLTNDYPYPDFVEVLHYSKDTVYGYNFGYRSLYGLKTDGTFRWSGGADDDGYSKLRFTSNNYEYDDIGYRKPNYPNPSYFINNQTVTESAYNDFIKSQKDKKDAIWYDFTEENIDNQLSTD